MAEKHEAGDGNGGGFGLGQASEAVDKLRSVIDQASQSIRELAQASEEWAVSAQERASEMAKEWRVQGEQVVGNVSERVEQNPMTSLAIAFAVGFLVATLVRR